MRQQINLYQPVFRRERKVFSAVAMIQVLALMFVALLGVYAWQFVATHALQQQLKADQQRQGTARMQLSALILKLSSRKVSPALAQALTQAQQVFPGPRKYPGLFPGAQCVVALGARRHLAYQRGFGGRGNPIFTCGTNHSGRDITAVSESITPSVGRFRIPLFHP